MDFECPFFVEDVDDLSGHQKAVNEYKQVIERFEKYEGVEISSASLTIADLVRSFSRDIKKLIFVDGVEDPSPFRVAGLICFWTRKLKPLQRVEVYTDGFSEQEQEDFELSMNEQFAIHIGMSMLPTKLVNLKVQSILKEKMYDDLISHLRYRAISPQAMAQLFEMMFELRLAHEEIVGKLLKALEYRDDETGQHVQRIGSIAQLMARRLAMDKDFIVNISLAAPMHDIGKIGIPDSILRKPDKLDDREFAVMKQHSIIGASIIGEAESSFLKMALVIARSHHERWDGKGYPDQIKGEDIPLEARIVCIADSFDAMTQTRVYTRQSKTIDEAAKEIEANSGKQFDPNLCAIFIELLDEIRKIYR